MPLLAKQSCRRSIWHLFWIIRSPNVRGLITRKRDFDATLWVVCRTHFLLFALIERAKSGDNAHRNVWHDPQWQRSIFIDHTNAFQIPPAMLIALLVCVAAAGAAHSFGWRERERRATTHYRFSVAFHQRLGVGVKTLEKSEERSVVFRLQMFRTDFELRNVVL